MAQARRPRSAPYRRAEQIEPLRRVARQKLRRLVDSGWTTVRGIRNTRPSCMFLRRHRSGSVFPAHGAWIQPDSPMRRNVDTFVLSKGHAAPNLVGGVATRRAPIFRRSHDPCARFGKANLEGHPTPNNPWGQGGHGARSGQGLAAANGHWAEAKPARQDRCPALFWPARRTEECSEGLGCGKAAQVRVAEPARRNIVAIVRTVKRVLGPERSDAPISTTPACLSARRFGAFGLAHDRDRRPRHYGHPDRQLVDAENVRTHRDSSPGPRKGKGGVSFPGGPSRGGLARARVAHRPSRWEKALAEPSGRDPGPIEKPSPRRVGQ